MIFPEKNVFHCHVISGYKEGNLIAISLVKGNQTPLCQLNIFFRILT